MKFNKEIGLQRLKRIGIIMLWLLMCTGVVVSLSFANKQYKGIVCSKIVVNIEPKNELAFIDREIVLKTMSPDGNEKKILGKSIEALNLPELETKLEANNFIRDAEVYSDMNGEIHIRIDQREPILRIFNTHGESYYIDKRGGKMPVSELFTARVPIANGNIFERYNKSDSIESFVLRELFTIASFIEQDAFWKAEIEQIFVTVENELVLVPKIGSHTILFGTTQEMSIKFSKLMTFYQEALSRVGWDKYGRIDLRFKNQVVARKK